jgi:hypothetical protein
MKNKSLGWTFVSVLFTASLTVSASAQQRANTTASVDRPSADSKAERDSNPSSKIACLYLASKRGDAVARNKLEKISQKEPSFTKAVIASVDRAERNAANPMLQGEWATSKPEVSQSESCD